MESNIISYLIWLDIPVLAIIVGIIWNRIQRIWTPGNTVSSEVCTVFGVVLLISMMFLWFVFYTFNLSRVQAFYAVRTMCEDKSIMLQHERYALALKATGQNVWLAKAQYWARFRVLGMFYPDEIKKLRPIR